MHAAYYERTGPADQVLRFGDLLDPAPGPGEVRVRLFEEALTFGLGSCQALRCAFQRNSVSTKPAPSPTFS